MARIAVPEWFNAASYFVDRNVDEGRGDTIAIVSGDRDVSYRQVAECVNRAGNALRSMGVEIEQRVMLLLLDCPEFAYCFFGAMKIGAVPVPVSTLLKTQDYEYLLNDSRARVLIVSALLFPVVEPLLQSLPYLRHVLVVGEQSSYPSFNDVLASASPNLDAARTNRDDVAFWLYTSGTTGRSRAAVHLHHDMVVCAEFYVQDVLETAAMDRTYSIAKLFFAYGLGNALYGPFSVGATTILSPDRPTPDTIFATVRQYRPTLFFAVPTAYAAILHAVDQGALVDMSSVRLCVSAGEALPANLYTRWRERFGVDILDGIGSTEILHIFLTNRPGAIRPGSSGRPVPGYKVRVVDEDGRNVPPGEIGSLIVRGDSTCAYYWNKHEATKTVIQGDWMRTGDKYTVDADGYFWHAGRTDDMLKVGGIWVSPTEVEACIQEHPSVLECAVVGAQDSDTLVKPKAFVVLKEPVASEVMVRELQEWVKGRIAPYKYPRWIEFVEELPKTATGKIQRFKLRLQA